MRKERTERFMVRKKFLEPTAGIRQEYSDYKYEGTWVASNLKLSRPNPETHPDFPLWELGYTPERVYFLFWPDGWHFCSPPGKATASGRFGPYRDGFWRHCNLKPLPGMTHRKFFASFNEIVLMWQYTSCFKPVSFQFPVPVYSHITVGRVSKILWSFGVLLPGPLCDKVRGTGALGI